MGREYIVVADPMGRELPVGPVICTGDLLHLAPPPGTDPAGSLLVEMEPEARSAYARNDTETILEYVRSLRGTEKLREAAETRYRSFFAQSGRLYYVAGNQDVPAALSAAATDFDDVAHVDELDGVDGVDGLIPAVANTPPDTFPCECSRERFHDRVATAGGDVLVAHTLPTGFDPTAYGYSVAVSSTNDGSRVSRDDYVLRLPSYRETGVTALLTLPDEDEGDPAVEVDDPPTIERSDSTHRGP